MADYHKEPDLESGKIVVPVEVQDAIRTLIRWTGDDPEREGLLNSKIIMNATTIKRATIPFSLRIFIGTFFLSHNSRKTNCP